MARSTRDSGAADGRHAHRRIARPSAKDAAPTATSTAYTHPGAFWIPAMVLTVLAFIYSLVDVGILTGHGVMMMVGWWAWFFAGYPGGPETVRLLS